MKNSKDDDDLFLDTVNTLISIIDGFYIASLNPSKKADFYSTLYYSNNTTPGQIIAPIFRHIHENPAVIMDYYDKIKKYPFEFLKKVHTEKDFEILSAIIERTQLESTILNASHKKIKL